MLTAEVHRALVDDRYDVALHALRQLPGKGLREKHGGAKVRIEVLRPTRLGDGADLVRLEQRGIVDEAGEAAQSRRGFIDQPVRHVCIRQVAPHNHRVAAHVADEDLGD